jgi:hypothetical protein
VLAAEAAVELQHEVGHLPHDRAHGGDAGLLVQVQHGADVQAADAGVAVEGAVGAVAVEDFAESRGELRQALRCDGRVLAERDGLGVAGHPVQERHGGTAQSPERVARRGVDGRHAGDQPRRARDAPAQFVDAVRHVRRVVGAELDHQERLGSPAHRGHRLLQRPLVARQVDEHPVHQLDCRRAEFEAQLQRVERRAERVELRNE